MITRRTFGAWIAGLWAGGFGLRTLEATPLEPEATAPGRMWFVDVQTGVDAVGYGQCPEKPFATPQHASDHVSSDTNDVIFWLPNSTENV